MKLSITPSLGFSAPPSPSSEPSVVVRLARPKRGVNALSPKVVRPPVESASAPTAENE